MPVFHLLGFPVRVRWGFILFLATVVVWNPEIGWKFAAAVTVFSLVHELGHAVVAKRYGGTPEIALDFFAGSTHYMPTRPLEPFERAGVALAGPAAAMVGGVVVLAAMRTNPVNLDSVFGSTWPAVVWVSGPMFSLLNLLPVLPLDGGHVATAALETLSPRRGRIWAVAGSAAVTVAFAVLAVAQRSLRWLAPFAGLLVVLQAWPLVPQRDWWARRRARRRVRRVAVSGVDSANSGDPEIS